MSLVPNEVITTGSPRFLDEKASAWAEQNLEVTRYVLPEDLIVHLPPKEFFGCTWDHVGKIHVLDGDKILKGPRAWRNLVTLAKAAWKLFNVDLDASKAWWGTGIRVVREILSSIHSVSAYSKRSATLPIDHRHALDLALNDGSDEDFGEVVEVHTDLGVDARVARHRKGWVGVAFKGTDEVLDVIANVRVAQKPWFSTDSVGVAHGGFLAQAIDAEDAIMDAVLRVQQPGDSVIFFGSSAGAAHAVLIAMRAAVWESMQAPAAA